MAKQRLWLVGLAAALLAAAGARAGDTAAPGKGDPLARDAQALAERIDRHVAARWDADGVRPAPLADDAEFLRRAYLDLAGRIPSVAEARDFLDDKSPDKRRRLVERLLDSSRYVTHFTDVWRALMLPESDANIQSRFLAPGFESWVRKQLAKNAPYDEMVRELLTTPVGPQSFQGIRAAGGADSNAAAFYIAKELKPENVAAATSRLFLGVRLECAQCHNHPFASWKREQFWGYAAFFAGLQRQGAGDFAVPGRELTDRRELTIPGTEKVVQARFLDGAEPRWKARASARETLADWMTSADNPYFARAAVNRLWGYFFGTGLVDPVDDMVGSERVPSHPELLDDLAREFAAHHFDLKFLIRAITTSKTYQLTSARTHPSQDEPQLFARMAVKGLTAEQLFDSLGQATGYQEPRNNLPPGVVVFGNASARQEFLTKFNNRSDKVTEVQTSILQALALMNGKLVADATSLERSETLAAVADAPFLDTRGRIETLYLATLGREPRPKELARLVSYVESGGSDGPGATAADRDKNSKQALADVFWALLNSGEFILNH
jgi:hypothetical protein